MSRSLSHRSLSRRWSLVILAAMAAAVFLVAWFGMATVAVPETSHAESRADAADTDAAATSELVDNATASRQRVSQRRGDVDHGRLIIVDATTAQPIPNVTVAITYSDQQRETWTSDEHGQTPLQPRADARLTIRADGYVRLEAQLNEAAAAEAKAELLIGLRPAGVLELRLAGERAARGETAEVVLLPQCPRVGEWSNDWRDVVPLFDAIMTVEQLGLQHRQDGVWIATEREPHPTSHKVVDGIARIDGVLPGDHYRWALKRGGPAVVNPPYERPALTENATGQAQVGLSEPEHLSGPFAIQAGETTAFDVKLLSTASIRGVFPVSGCEIPPQVKLYRLETLQPANGPAVCRSQDLAFVVASEQGGFLFDGLAPGTYAVRAWWRQAEVVQFCSATCVLASDDVDLGEIDVVTGERVFVRLDLRERGTSRTLSPAEALPGVALKMGAVMIQAVPDSKLAHEQVFEALPIAFEQTYELRGLRPGTLSLEPRLPPWLLASGMTSKLEVTAGVRGQLEPGILHQLHLILEPRHEWLLELPEEFRGKPFEVLSRRTMDGEVRRLEVRGPSGLNDLPYLRVLAPRCDQELFFRELASPHRFAFVEVQEPPTAPSLQPVFESQAPLRVACADVALGEVVGWTLRGWKTTTPIWSTSIESDGSAILHGVPTKRGLTGLASAPDVPAR